MYIIYYNNACLREIYCGIERYYFSINSIRIIIIDPVARLHRVEEFHSRVTETYA